ncbi:MAG TPA: hypothetical protein VIK53_12670 [Verrucomicrobiae bacterium]
METPPESPPEIRDKWIQKFLAHLAVDRGAFIALTSVQDSGLEMPK